MLILHVKEETIVVAEEIVSVTAPLVMERLIQGECRGSVHRG